MSVYTRQDLKTMQAWPLERKVAETKELIAEWYDAFNGLVYVSFSAGKDSTLLLRLAREVHPDIPAVYVDTGCEYPENVAFAQTIPNVVFFHVKSGLQAMKNSIVAGVNRCDKAVADIDTFAKEYHAAGRHLKNMARMAVGRKPVDTQKEAGKLARAVSAPYRAEKACLLGARKAANAVIAKLEQLEHGAESARKKRSAAKKPTLMERLDANKEKIRQMELEKPIPERAPKAQGLEV